ncbi:hypothetical protein BDV97DRAFT_151684 [Delphinella strobiligena]|nr:hypothetical protein BDV97DRAFT_151684 [Delphinella strobiligena]
MATRKSSPSPLRTTPETLQIDLDRLLTRLSNQLLPPTTSSVNADANSNAAEPTSLGSKSTLENSTYERSRVGANVEYARTLLLRLEHASGAIKTGTRKTAMQTELERKREIIKRLNQRLLELGQLDDSSSDGTDTSDQDGEAADEEEGEAAERKTHPSFAPAKQARNQIDYDPLSLIPGLSDIPPSAKAIRAAQASAAAEPTLRARNKTDPIPSTLSSAANLSQPALANTTALLGSRSTRDEKLNTTQLLESRDHDHNALTSSLVTLAQSLKSSSLSFQSALASEKEVLKRAEQGLERNEAGMEKAGRGMGALRRMTEGQGWWGRIKLYAVIGGLWLLCFLLVFLGPKMRF